MAEGGSKTVRASPDPVPALGRGRGPDAPYPKAAGPDAAWPQVCAHEFRGREFSCRPLAGLVPLVGRLALSEDQLFSGVRYPRSHLLDVSQRIDWASVEQIAKNLSARLTEEQLVELGSMALGSRSLRFLTLIARALFTPVEYYRFAGRELTRYCACMGAYVREVGPNEVQLHVLVETGYPVITELFLTLQGALQSMTEVYGRGSAQVSLSLVPRGAVFRIELPVVRGLRATLSRIVGRRGAMRAAARDLREANDLLHQRDAALLRRESELLLSEQKYRSVLEASQDAIFVIDRGGRVLDANGRAAAMIGIALDELVGRAPTDFVELGVIPMRRFWRELRENGHAATEALLRRADGSVFPVEASCRELDGREIHAVLSDIRERKRIEYELARQARELDARVAARTAELERANDELRRQQTRLIEAERLRALEHVSSKLSAALNPAVAKLLETLEGVASMEQVADGGVAQGLALAHEISVVVATTLSQIGVGGGSLRTWEKPADLVADAIGLLAAQLDAAAVSVELDVPADLEAVRVDRGLFVGALAAVAANGIEAMPPEGLLRVEVSESVSGRRLQLRISDEGPGIPPELLPRVVEPHFTTKPGRAGLGLPLAVGVIQGHGGRLEIAAAPAGGCEICIDLPIDVVRPRV